MKEIKFSDFNQSMRDRVLESLDSFMKEQMGFEKAIGWGDTDLPTIFGFIDSYAKKMAQDVNDGIAPGSLVVRIDMDN